jgi:hypothetical protein
MTYLNFRACLLFIFTFLLAAGVAAQDKTVSGVVQTEAGGPLPGATILLVGTSTATISDADGKFSIVAQSGQTMRVTFIGYQPTDIPVTDQVTYTITLQEDAHNLQEFVVIGYQSVRRTDLTGATGIIDTQTTSKRVARSVPEALAGNDARCAGAERGSARPGSGSQHPRIEHAFRQRQSIVCDRRNVCRRQYDG